MDTEQSVFIGDMVLHRSAYSLYRSVFYSKGYRELRKLLRKRWYSKGEQNKIISKIHQDEPS